MSVAPAGMSPSSSSTPRNLTSPWGTARRADGPRRRRAPAVLGSWSPSRLPQSPPPVSTTGRHHQQLDPVVTLPIGVPVLGQTFEYVLPAVDELRDPDRHQRRPCRQAPLRATAAHPPPRPGARHRRAVRHPATLLRRVPLNIRDLHRTCAVFGTESAEQSKVGWGDGYTELQPYPPHRIRQIGEAFMRVDRIPTHLQGYHPTPSRSPPKPQRTHGYAARRRGRTSSKTTSLTAAPCAATTPTSTPKTNPPPPEGTAMTTRNRPTNTSKEHTMAEKKRVSAGVVAGALFVGWLWHAAEQATPGFTQQQVGDFTGAVGGGASPHQRGQGRRPGSRARQRPSVPADQAAPPGSSAESPEASDARHPRRHRRCQWSPPPRRQERTPCRRAAARSLENESPCPPTSTPPRPPAAGRSTGATSPPSAASNPRIDRQRTSRRHRPRRRRPSPRRQRRRRQHLRPLRQRRRHLQGAGPDAVHQIQLELFGCDANGDGRADWNNIWTPAPPPPPHLCASRNAGASRWEALRDITAAGPTPPPTPTVPSATPTPSRPPAPSSPRRPSPRSCLPARLRDRTLQHRRTPHHRRRRLRSADHLRTAPGRMGSHRPAHRTGRQTPTCRWALTGWSTEIARILGGQPRPGHRQRTHPRPAPPAERHRSTDRHRRRSMGRPRVQPGRTSPVRLLRPPGPRRRRGHAHPRGHRRHARRLVDQGLDRQQLGGDQAR